MFPLSGLQVYDDHEIRSAAENMAVDEALLELESAPALRFYRWRRPSLSFGYFGSFAEVEAEEAQREIVRRWTGGGIVLHGTDLTYSIILPHHDAPASLGARAIYTQVHEVIRLILSKQSNVVLAASNAPKISDACFANPVIADLLADGRKIAGAAQRRTRAGLLHQGSIQYEALPDGFQDAFARALCPHFSRRVLSSGLIKRAEAISEQKYGTAAWMRRR